MNLSFKQLIYSFTLFSITLLTYRIFKSESLSYLFLPWNLFLAFIPWWLSDYLKNKRVLNYCFIPLAIVWLLFIPNAPYLLTDLFHLRPRPYLPLWFDLVLVLSFALTGLMVFFKSLRDMLFLLKRYVHPFVFNVLVPLVFWLISFGLYIGRFLRFNSWDMIHPIHVLKGCVAILGEKDTLGFTCIFTLFLWFVYDLIVSFSIQEKTGHPDAL